jgi:serine/threonine protein kinase
VAFTHRLTPPIVHRDLKPANVLVQRGEGGQPLLKVTDFGIGALSASQAIREESRQPHRSLTFATAIRGAYTPLYAPPQQRRGQPADPRDDVFALGVMGYQMLVGDVTAERPGGRGWRRRFEQKGLPVPLLDLLGSCFDDDAEERPANATAFLDRLPLAAPSAPGRTAGKQEQEPHVTGRNTDDLSGDRADGGKEKTGGPSPPASDEEKLSEAEQDLQTAQLRREHRTNVPPDARVNPERAPAGNLSLAWAVPCDPDGWPERPRIRPGVCGPGP